MSTTIINIDDRAAQSIVSYPTTCVDVFVEDTRDRYYSCGSENIGIETASSGTVQTKIQFTDGLFTHDTELLNMADITEQINVNTNMYNTMPYTSFLILTTGSYGDDSETAAPETHEISGQISHDGKIICLDAVTSELIKTKEVSAGAYTVSVPNQTMDVVAKKNNSDALAYGDIEPVIQ